MNALTVTGLSGSQQPPKVDGPEGDETKEFVSMNADPPRPAHPPKVSGEQFHNTFMCDALIAMVMSCMTLPVTKGRPTLTRTVMAKQRSSLILLVNLRAR